LFLSRFRRDSLSRAKSPTERGVARRPRSRVDTTNRRPWSWRKTETNPCRNARMEAPGTVWSNENRPVLIGIFRTSGAIRTTGTEVLAQPGPQSHVPFTATGHKLFQTFRLE